MAQSLVTSEGTLIIPGASATWRAATENSGLSTTGIIVLVGEADAGPSFDLEPSLDLNSFGPDQTSEVLSKYVSGNLVDAYRVAVTAANDPNITGAPSAIKLVKTNNSVRAKSSLLGSAGNFYASLADKNYGKSGNMIYWQTLANTSEVVPTTGPFTWISNVGATAIDFRVNGEAHTVTLTGGITPTAAVAAITGVTGVLATGGVLRTVLPASGTLSLTATGANAVILYSGTFTTTPLAGDTLEIYIGSAIAGGTTPGKNIGSYLVVSATSNTVNVTKLSDSTRAAAVPGTVTNPENVATTSSQLATTDINVYSPVTISVDPTSPTILPGVGKSLEIAQIVGGGGTDLIERSCFVLGSIVSSPWISKVNVPYVLTSASEYSAKIKINRQTDAVQEELTAGGEIALKLGYTGDTASAVIDGVTMTITVTGGTGTSIGTLNLKDFTTLADLAQFINSKTGYTCSLGSNTLGQMSAVNLDDGTYSFATKFGSQVARIKIDAYRFYKKIANESILAQILNVSDVSVQAASGLPAPTTAWAYLSGGTKGGTTSQNFVDAITACEKVRGNFIVPLFSRDATLDKADSLTERASTYEIDDINSLVRTHVLAMSTLKKKRNRQGILSKKDTFLNAKLAASDIATFRCAMPFQDFKSVGGDGATHQYAPWMSAVDAAGMQTAAFYKAIVHKYANTSGAVQAAGDFDDQDDSAMEQALVAGLLPMKRAESGGWYWVSDQTTYGKDSNFVYNSIQATYVADIISMTTATRMENAFVGQSIADISAVLAKSFVGGIMSDFLRLKLISPSDDAPQGYKNLVIKINGTAMLVSCEVKLAGCIYFIPINFLVSQVTQTA